ncbi:MAG: hypothetical protein ABL962_09660 [Fimbriimonadaceae bacterium]
MSLAQPILPPGVRQKSTAPTTGAGADAFATLENETASMFAAIAGKLEREPGLLTVPLNNIARWLAKGHPSVARLNAWKRKIEMAERSPSEFTALLSLLRDSSPEAMQWKGFSPFAGVLTPAELDALTWTSHR